MCVDDVSALAHGTPNVKSHRIHIEKAYLLTALATFAIYADGSQELGLSRDDKVWPDANGWRIVNILHFAGGLRDRSVYEATL